ncbi:inactive phospholipase D5 isoform B [Patagioenas fasciata monilis]|uniref:Inactive phospholipase D5 isoform B n=2 Tax=Patagioenas fasciata TaxID=372321 RepID=A0A1V4JKG5_PATFA|nr:inactive phospholipase D5 isoform B [Patagioenas fasciata monilis]
MCILQVRIQLSEVEVLSHPRTSFWSHKCRKKSCLDKIIEAQNLKCSVDGCEVRGEREEKERGRVVFGMITYSVTTPGESESTQSTLMEVRHDWLSSSPHEGFEQMRLKSRPREPSPSLTRVGANFYSTVKQQDYSASVWLRRKDKLEHGQRLFEKLLELASRNIEIKLVSDILPVESKVLNDLKTKGAEVLYMNMSAYNEGRLQSSFWIVDKQHVYIGSASLDWRSLGQMKELGVIVYNCSCLVLDLQRIFALYSSLRYKNKIPPSWSKRLYGVYDTQNKLTLQLNETKSEAFVSNSPKLFCPKDRVLDIEAIYSVIDDAKQFVYIAVTDYLPIITDTNAKRYWPYLDGKIREALVLRSIKVRLLISFSRDTDPLTFNFVSSLKAICTEVPSCSLKVKFFDLEEENACFLKEQKNTSLPKLNRNKYMVTDGAAYIGNFDWVGNAFTQNAGAGLVINQADTGNSTSIIKQLKAVFERDWYSPYAKSLQPTKIPNCFNHKLNKATSNKTAMSNVN